MQFKVNEDLLKARDLNNETIKNGFKSQENNNTQTKQNQQKKFTHMQILEDIMHIKNQNGDLIFGVLESEADNIRTELMAKPYKGENFSVDRDPQHIQKYQLGVVRAGAMLEILRNNPDYLNAKANGQSTSKFLVEAYNKIRQEKTSGSITSEEFDKHKKVVMNLHSLSSNTYFLDNNQDKLDQPMIDSLVAENTKLLKESMDAGIITQEDFDRMSKDPNNLQNPNQLRQDLEEKAQKKYRDQFPTYDDENLKKELQKYCSKSNENIINNILKMIENTTINETPISDSTIESNNFVRQPNENASPTQNQSNTNAQSKPQTSARPQTSSSVKPQPAKVVAKKTATKVQPNFPSIASNPVMDGKTIFAAGSNYKNVEKIITDEKTTYQVINVYVIAKIQYVISNPNMSNEEKVNIVNALEPYQQAFGYLGGQVDPSRLIGGKVEQESNRRKLASEVRKGIATGKSVINIDIPALPAPSSSVMLDNLIEVEAGEKDISQVSALVAPTIELTDKDFHIGNGLSQSIKNSINRCKGNMNKVLQEIKTNPELRDTVAQFKQGVNDICQGAKIIGQGTKEIGKSIANLGKYAFGKAKDGATKLKEELTERLNQIKATLESQISEGELDQSNNTQIEEIEKALQSGDSSTSTALKELEDSMIL